MIVADASALIELLLQTSRAEAVSARLAVDANIHAPHLLDVEVAQSLRRLVRLGELTVARAEHALEDFAELVIERHAHVTLLARVWELRETASAYDGAYLALAEALDAPLLTCDGKLARSHGHRAKVMLIN